MMGSKCRWKFVVSAAAATILFLGIQGCATNEKRADNTKIGQSCDEIHSLEELSALFDIDTQTLNIVNKERQLLPSTLCKKGKEKIQKWAYRSGHSTESESPEEFFKERSSRWIDEFGIKSNQSIIYANELRHGMTIDKKFLRKAVLSASTMPRTTGLKREEWINLGPFSTGGRVRSLAITPQPISTSNAATYYPIETGPYRMWLGSAAGGIWYSDNYQDQNPTWLSPDAYMGNLAITSLLVDDNNPNRMYASTGEGFGRTIVASSSNPDNYFVPGAGVLRTQDGGNTWQPIWSPVKDKENDPFYYINRMATLKKSPMTILVAATNQLWILTDKTYEWGSFQTWELALSLPQSHVIFDAKTSPKHPGKAFITTNQGIIYVYDDATKHTTEVLNAEKIYRGCQSENVSAAGATVCTTVTPHRIEVEIGKSDGKIYAASVPSGAAGTLYASENGGKDWAISANNLTNYFEQGWYNNTIWIDPSNSNHIILGGVVLIRSFDGGATFHQIRAYGSPDIHVDNHIIIEDPGYTKSNRKLYVGHDGGVSELTLSENTFPPICLGNNQECKESAATRNVNGNISITEFQGTMGLVTSNMRGFDIAVGTLGSQDNGSWLYQESFPSSNQTFTPSDRLWRSIDGGDGFDTDIQFSTEKQLFEIVSSRQEGTVIYQELTLEGVLQNRQIVAHLASGKRDQFSTKFIRKNGSDGQPANEILLRSGMSVYKSWWPRNNPIDPSTAQDKAYFGRDLSQITSIAKGKNTDYWIGHLNGFLSRVSTRPTSQCSLPTLDNGSTDSPEKIYAIQWIYPLLSIDRTPLPKNRRITAIHIDQNNPSRVFVGYGGRSERNLWVTEDEGCTWKDISGYSATTGENGVPLIFESCEPLQIGQQSRNCRIPPAPVTAIAVHPNLPYVIYIGTEVGLFRSENGGYSWYVADGPANLPIEDLKWGNRKGAYSLFASTRGRGLYEIKALPGKQAFMKVGHGVVQDSNGNLVPSNLWNLVVEVRPEQQPDPRQGYHFIAVYDKSTKSWWYFQQFKDGKFISSWGGALTPFNDKSSALTAVTYLGVWDGNITSLPSNIEVWWGFGVGTSYSNAFQEMIASNRFELVYVR